jgi:hypothetical protein
MVFGNMRDKYEINYNPLIIINVLVNINFALQGQVNIEDDNNYTCTPFINLVENTAGSFSGKNLLLHTAGFLSTYLLIHAETDFRVQRYFDRRREYNPYTIPAVWVGYTLPLVLGGSLYVSGRLEMDNEILTAGCAVLQSTLIATVYAGTLKAITGRPHPDPQDYSDMKKASRTFRFGFMQGGVHYGWPSGHLIVNTAAVTSLMQFYPRNGSLKFLGSLYLVYLVFGVTAHEGATMHWFSDVAAGTLFGLAIGPTVGKNFRNHYDKSAKGIGTTKTKIIPLILPEGMGLSLCMNF